MMTKPLSKSLGLVPIICITAKFEGSESFYKFPECLLHASITVRLCIADFPYFLQFSILFTSFGIPK